MYFQSTSYYKFLSIEVQCRKCRDRPVHVHEGESFHFDKLLTLIFRRVWQLRSNSCDIAGGKLKNPESVFLLQKILG